MPSARINNRLYEEYAIKRIEDPIRALSGLSIPSHDYAGLTYDVSGNLTGVTYKSGGSSGTLVATLVLVYDAESNLISVSKSE